ncbi:MAG: hypothetical protein KAS32_01725 [Candidatus Peribacteraceae bacterium]|nr:hypothetical protein [Candidatus Peribacteraceae bacterium]
MISKTYIEEKIGSSIARKVVARTVKSYRKAQKLKVVPVPSTAKKELVRGKVYLKRQDKITNRVKEI